MPTNPTPITSLPTAPDRSDRATFSSRATAMFDALKNNFVSETNALASVTYSNSNEAVTAASTATTAAGTATSAASTATTKASEASSSASSAASSATTATTAANTATTKASEAFYSAAAAAASVASIAGGPVASINGKTGVVTLNQSDVNEAAAVSLASASTIDIGAQSATTINVTGTTTVTSLGTAAAGVCRRLIFAGALTLTHNATSLILPGAANITTAAGDVAEFLSLGAGNWTCVAYQKADGNPVITPSSIANLVRSARTSNAILGVSDKGTLVDITSGTFTQTFNAASTLGNGWWCYIRNSGSGDITLDPNASETIDGLTSYIMYPGEVRLVQCDGSALQSVVLNAFYRAFTSSGTFTKPPGYNYFIIDAIGAGDGGHSGGGGQANTYGGSSGGKGGNGGNCIHSVVNQSLVATTTTVTVGLGGTGGAQSSSGGLQNLGTAGGITTFGSIVSSVSTDQGGYFLGATGSGGSSGSTSTVSAPASVTAAKAGGGGGGGGSGGSQSSATPSGATGGTSIFAGAGGTGGKGGTGSTPQAGTAGSNGTAPGGGGGGGGGGSDNFGIGGKGGDGARGELRIFGVI